MPTPPSLDLSQIIRITRQLKMVVLILILAVIISTAVATQILWYILPTSNVRPEVFFSTIAVLGVLCMGIAVAFNTAIRKQQLLEEGLRRLEQDQVRAAKLETILDVAVTVNHEINNPLTAILTEAQILRRHHSNADETTQLHLSRIVEGADRIAQVTRRLREVTEPLQTSYLPGTMMLDLPEGAAGKRGGEEG